MSTRTCKVGIHGRNDDEFFDPDFEVIREARIEIVKMMSQTRPHHFDRILRENPGVEIITRLRGGGFGEGHHSEPGQFASEMIPIMGTLRQYCVKFQIHNEPNHFRRYEGWGDTDADATSFNSWFLEVYDRLKNAHPWASLGFPGLAVPHRDWEWLNICRPAVERADWLGVHCYWQTPPNQPGGIFHERFGLNFKHYHDQFPAKTIEILECGNSNGDNNLPITDDAIGEEYVRWLNELFKYPYVNSASFFMLSSQGGGWPFFSWRTEAPFKRPMIWHVGNMFRPPFGPLQVGPAKPVQKPPTKPKPTPTGPIPVPTGITNQQVINAFNRVSLQLGMGNWGLMNAAQAGLKLAFLAAHSKEAYTGPRLDEMPGLTDQQRQLIRAALPEGISFAFAVTEAFLIRYPDLATMGTGQPKALRIPLSRARSAVERRVARTWNGFGFMLKTIADILGLGLPSAVALLALEREGAGIANDGRLTIRFEVNAFLERWGRENAEAFGRHFQMDAARPWQGHGYRTTEADGWRDVHASHESEWEAFRLASSLDPAAARAATAMGFPGILGINCALVGYDSAAQMFDAFTSSERYQVLALFDLIAGQNAGSRELEALRGGDIAAFAALYYGPRRAAAYTTRLGEAAAAFARLNPLAE